MKIGIDASRIAREDKTGTENYSLNLIKAIAEVDRLNHYVLYFNKIPRFFEISQPNFSTKVLPSPRFWTQGRLAFECFIRPPDILFVPAHTMPVVRRPNLKTVVTIHDLGAEFLAEYHQFPQKLYLSWSTKYVAGHATHIISISKFTKKDLMKTLRVPASRISVVYEAVDREVFYLRSSEEVNNVKTKYGLNKNYFLYVGTIQPRKNLPRLIEAFAKARLKNTDLVLAGSQGWLVDEINKAPKKFSISERVRFLGFVDKDEVAALYSGAVGLAFPSLYEGFGLPILEAFACECPVLTSKIGAMAEIAGSAAILVDPLDAKDIAAGLKKLAKNKRISQDLVKKGGERVKNFSWEAAAKETINMFEKTYKEK
jgi:glycosyltransferase involved in cell wall biosynthesis